MLHDLEISIKSDCEVSSLPLAPLMHYVMLASAWELSRAPINTFDNKQVNPDYSVQE